MIFEKVTDAIVSFEAENHPSRHRVCMQVRIDPYQVSPSGKFIRFEQFVDGETVNEIHGWILMEDILVEEVLQDVKESDYKVELACSA